MAVNPNGQPGYTEGQGAATSVDHAVSATPSHAVACALCGPGIGYRVRYAARLPKTTPNFAARHTPDRRHYRIVQCNRCGLVFSNPILPPETIARLYCDAEFAGETQLANYCDDYLALLRRALPMVDRADRLLEIGCANGYFLEAARAMGIAHVAGVEPCADAVAQATPAIRSSIVNDFFHAGLFVEETFDIVCLFQVLDHALDPVGLMRGVERVLRPGGVVLVVSHNIRSWAARMLGRNSPMLDVQHVYLFDPKTIAVLFERVGLGCIWAESITSGYGLGYAVKMLSVLPLAMRSVVGRVLDAARLGTFRIRLPGGNMAAIARKGPAG